MKHTMGPWHACKGGDCKCGLIWDATGNCLVAVAQGEDHIQDMMGPDCVPINAAQRANARLISAAPELLAALKGVVAVADRKTDEFDAARAAIAKAENQEATNASK